MRDKNIISLAVLALAFAAGWLINGWRLQSRISRMQAEQAQAIQASSEEARKKEKALQEKIDNLNAAYREERDHAQKYINSLRADIAAGRLRLSVPTSCPGTRAGSGAEHTETRAELDPETADALVAIAAEGDEAIRELNLCVDAYGAGGS
ncbi:MAG: lysis protein [Alistipes senegalensis]|nr:lysis protein [Oxalobacter formigenes]MCM1280955.1 lysis protein [Alistipes senegalensis]